MNYDAILDGIREANIGHWAQMAYHRIEEAVFEHKRPSAIFKPSLSIDGDMWCALCGENLQDGVAGFGKSPGLAMVDFDKNWETQLTSK
jgi:hypothetical protein